MINKKPDKIPVNHLLAVSLISVYPSGMTKSIQHVCQPCLYLTAVQEAKEEYLFTEYRKHFKFSQYKVSVYVMSEYICG